MNDCEHVWDKQPNYSASGSGWAIQRFKCSKCSCWAYKQYKRIIPYSSGGVHVLEPRPEWAATTTTERGVDWSTVGGSNPDRNTWDDDSADYRPPRRW